MLLAPADSPGQEVLPRPEGPSRGKVGLTFKDSEPVEPELKIPGTFGLEGPPNILLVLIDDAPGRRTTQSFEMLGNQGIDHDGWMAGALRGAPWPSEPEPGDLPAMPWELDHVDEDSTPVVDDDRPPFAFSGRLDSVTISLD